MKRFIVKKFSWIVVAGLFLCFLTMFPPIQIWAHRVMGIRTNNLITFVRELLWGTTVGFDGYYLNVMYHTPDLFAFPYMLYYAALLALTGWFAVLAAKGRPLPLKWLNGLLAIAVLELMVAVSMKFFYGYSSPRDLWPIPSAALIVTLGVYIGFRFLIRYYDRHKDEDLPPPEKKNSDKGRVRQLDERVKELEKKSGER